MRNRGAVVAVVVMCLSCFSTARYDRAHTQRVSEINARYNAALERESEHHAALLTELARRRSLAIPVMPEAGDAPKNRVDERDGIVECCRMCGAKPGDLADPTRARSHTAQCLRDVCLPSYVDALVKTYVHADVASVISQLRASGGAELESALARSHNQAVLADIERRAAVVEQRHLHARNRLEHERQRALQASMRQRDTEIAVGRAARRARVKAAADAFAAEARGEPAATSVTAPRRGAPSDHLGGSRAPNDCAGDPSCQPSTRGPSITCTPDPDDTIAQATDPANHPPGAPSTPIACTDHRDCPSGLSCDLATGACCATSLH